ncbi:glycoside hydrolase family 108 protein [Xanthomonas maliensis]|uniref:glycoside hydrolase family 108 protein n=1 Tax=Xanthomonas maliensis TaxID=1321368 RepID=UPI0003A53DD9|nr:glycosyl hydrolase 108 family protein [Xanthomonas maliensis]KAB7767620.1 peptidoglycan domain protein [Xanthomonas maliensis]
MSPATTTPPDADFNVLIERVLSHEGGYVNDPQDPGGETQWGISKRSYPQLNIRALTRADAIAIYRRDFWARVQGDKLPDEFAFQALDAAVNHGIGNAVRWMQRAAGVADDGVIGPVTLAAIAIAQPADLVLVFNAIRLEFYAKLETFSRFGRGWTTRVAGNLRYAARDNG